MGNRLSDLSLRVGVGMFNLHKKVNIVISIDTDQRFSISLLACNQVHNSSNGSIKSPNFPSNYPNDVNCHYLILSSDPAKRIKITFLQFRLEYAENCGYDSVRIYDGYFLNATQLGPTFGYCGNSVPPTLTSTGNVVLIVFASDKSITYQGFQITYKSKLLFRCFV